MTKLPENFDLLHQGEEQVRRMTIDLIEGDDDLSQHMVLIEAAMDLLNRFSMAVPPNEDEDAKAVRLLGMRVFNGFGSSFGLVASGYYQTAAMVARDLLETVFLLDYLHDHPVKIAIWRTADEKVRKKEFAPAKVRISLDDRDGFTAKKREAAYSLLCELAAHPTYFGLRMLVPKGGSHHCGPFFDASSATALIQELAKLAVQAGGHYGRFAQAVTLDDNRAKIAFMEIRGRWTERYFGYPFPHQEFAELRAVLNNIEAEQARSVATS